MTSGPVLQRFTQLVTGTVSVVEFLGVAVAESVFGFVSSSRGRCLEIAFALAYRFLTSPRKTARSGATGRRHSSDRL
jgi:hypothetical protein